MASQSYSSAFKRHVSFFDLDGDGIISFGEPLRASLSLGLNFPVAAATVFIFAFLGGNTGFYSSHVNIQNLTFNQTQLEDLKIRQDSYTRADLMQITQGFDWTNWLHVMTMWVLAADGSGRVSSGDMSLYQRGQLLPALAKRRQDRSNALPFTRGGPIFVAGHAFFVHLLFDVPVYQAKKGE